MVNLPFCGVATGGTQVCENSTYRSSSGSRRNYATRKRAYSGKRRDGTVAHLRDVNARNCATRNPPAGLRFDSTPLEVIEQKSNGPVWPIKHAGRLSTPGLAPGNFRYRS
jgi:hypothetical protein